MSGGIRVAYLAVYCGLLFVSFLIDVSWRVMVLIGIGVMVPVAVADIVISRRRRASTSPSSDTQGR